MPSQAPCRIIFVCNPDDRTWHIDGTETDVTALVNNVIAFSEFDRCRLTDMGSIVVSWKPGEHGGGGASFKKSAGKASAGKKSTAMKSAGGGKPAAGRKSPGGKKSSRR